MKQVITILFIFPLLSFNLPAFAAKSSPVKKTTADNLFVIVLNGVRYNDTYGDKHHLYIENIWEKLRPLGTICTRFENRELTFPIPSQMSLLTGVWHVFKNPLSKTIPPAVPTLFEYWNSKRSPSGTTCFFASNRDEFKILKHSNQTGYGKIYAPVFEASDKDNLNENSIYEKVMPYILENKPSLVYISLGSAGGGGTENDLLHADEECQLPGEEDACGGGSLLNLYYESIILMDGIVYDLWDRIQKEDQYKDNTVFLVLSSHGRHTHDFHGYGDKCRGCRQLFLLAIGPGIRKNHVSKRKRTLIDICRTVGYSFGIPTPFAKGRIMKELFE
jgi:hypothetical protein